MEFRAETHQSSPGLERGTKKIFELLNSVSSNITEACWKRMGLKRFSSLQDVEDADEESRLLNMMENLEIEEEEDREREAENDEVQEVPVTRKPPAVEDDKKIQSQITSFFMKK
ncbi:unnamed protein product [Oikopleura dioica]|uniref:Uncharacterized protein n=1 Tax=Oikopleura dioica TaxID=34765 RepID=E4Y3L3_OIKDI|nr:unnamed protein product [Oikopleura dioica]